MQSSNRVIEGRLGKECDMESSLYSDISGQDNWHEKFMHFALFTYQKSGLIMQGWARGYQQYHWLCATSLEKVRERVYIANRFLL